MSKEPQDLSRARNAISFLPIRRSLIPTAGGFFMPPIPVDFYQPLGAITLFWGGLESRIDGLIELLWALKAAPADVLARESFQKKLKALNKELLVSPIFTEPAKQLISSILLVAGRIQQNRNLLVHGQYSHTFPADGSKGELCVLGTRKGKPIEIRFSVSDLELMYHEIGLACSDLDMCFTGGHVPSPLSLLERQKLQELLSRHLNRSMIAKPASQP